MLIRSGGTRAWRCNNPGNLKRSSYSMGKDRRAIGFAGVGENFYAVYPDYETGHEALIVMLKGSKYSPLTLRKVMIRYDKANPKYIDEIVKITKFDPERTIKSLNPQEFEQFWKAIERVEKWVVGREDPVDKWYITGVHKKRGVITEYLIAQKGGNVWIEKAEALKLAAEQRLHAVIVHAHSGVLFLRPESGKPPFQLIK